MGRSVWTHSDAVETVFFEWNCGYCPKCECLTTTDGWECPECGGELEPDVDGAMMFDEEIDYIRDHIKERFPSFEKCDHWPERESHAIAENKLGMLVISEYCGLVSLGIVPTGECYYDEDTTGLARAWCEKYVAPWLRETYGSLRKVGTFSNGEAVYERRA